MGFAVKKFSQIDLNDSFFDSLKSDYKEFSEWFQKKAENKALIHFDENGLLNGFLYLKVEDEELNIDPPQGIARRLKVGTMKIDAHGTRLGERFIKKIFDKAFAENVDEIYVTIFAKHQSLITLFKTYNFNDIGLKQSQNGSENVLGRKLKGGHLIPSYPFIPFKQDTNIYFLSIYPMFHSRLFPDSILKNENATILQDISPTNSIHKVYIAGMKGMNNLKTGDILLIYRTAEQGKLARYSSVITSVCAVEEFRDINSFNNLDDFKNYCRKYSIFTESELDKIYKEKKYIYVIKMTYNIALNKRINRARLIDMGIMSNSPSFYSGFGQISINQLIDIIREGNSDESIIIDQT